MKPTIGYASHPGYYIMWRNAGIMTGPYRTPEDARSIIVDADNANDEELEAASSAYNCFVEDFKTDLAPDGSD